MTDHRVATRHAHRRRSRRYAGALIGMIAALTIGCRLQSKPRRLESEYGDLRSGRAERTVDGLDIFAEMFRRNGHHVQHWRRLSPRLMGKERRADEPDPDRLYSAIVWAPRSLAELSKKQYEFLGQYVDDGGTLILIGSDDDPVSEYWKRTLTKYEGKNVPLIVREAMLDRSVHQRRLLENLPIITPWCRYDWRAGDPKVDRLSGDWADGIDVEETDIRVSTPMTLFRPDPKLSGLELLKSLLPDFDLDDESSVLPQGSNRFPFTDPETPPELLDWPNDAPLVLRKPKPEILLDSNRGPLVVRIWGKTPEATEEMEEDAYYFDEVSEGKVILCTNGSFLLNLGMLAPGNRELAQRIVDECEGDGPVAVIDPHPWFVRVRNTEEGGRHLPPRHEPLGTILDHVTILAIVVCFVFFPIFGRPKRHPAEPLSDFGEHIDAVAELMEKAGDAEYAKRQIAAYRQLTRRDDRASPP